MVPAAGSVSIPTSMPESGHEAPRLPVRGIPGRGRPLWILPAPQTQHRGGKPQMSPVPWPQFPWSSVSREDGFSDTHCPWGSSPECRRTPKQGKGPHEPYTKVTHTHTAASKPGRDMPAPSQDNGEVDKAQGRCPAQLLSRRSQNQDHRASRAGSCLPSKLGFPAGVDTVMGWRQGFPRPQRHSERSWTLPVSRVLLLQVASLATDPAMAGASLSANPHL